MNISRCVVSARGIARSVPPQPQPRRFGERLRFQLEGLFQVRTELADLGHQRGGVVGQAQEPQDHRLGVGRDDVDPEVPVPFDQAFDNVFRGQTVVDGIDFGHADRVERIEGIDEHHLIATRVVGIPAQIAQGVRERLHTGRQAHAAQVPDHRDGALAIGLAASIQQQRPGPGFALTTEIDGAVVDERAARLRGDGSGENAGATGSDLRRGLRFGGGFRGARLRCRGRDRPPQGLAAVAESRGAGRAAIAQQRLAGAAFEAEQRPALRIGKRDRAAAGNPRFRNHASARTRGTAVDGHGYRWRREGCRRYHRCGSSRQRRPGIAAAIRQARPQVIAMSLLSIEDERPDAGFPRYRSPA
jgi:hypothetical protein